MAKKKWERVSKLSYQKGYFQIINDFLYGKGKEKDDSVKAIVEDILPDFYQDFNFGYAKKIIQIKNGYRKTAYRCIQKEKNLFNNDAVKVWLNRKDKSVEDLKLEIKHFLPWQRFVVYMLTLVIQNKHFEPVQGNKFSAFDKFWTRFEFIDDPDKYKILITKEQFSLQELRNWKVFFNSLEAKTLFKSPMFSLLPNHRQLENTYQEISINRNRPKKKKNPVWEDY